MKAKEFDKKFETGDDILENLDITRAKRPNREQQRISIDFPQWMVTQLEKEANRLGVTRQAIIKVWLSERLEKSETIK